MAWQVHRSNDKRPWQNSTQRDPQHAANNCREEESNRRFSYNRSAWWDSTSWSYPHEEVSNWKHCKDEWRDAGWVDVRNETLQGTSDWNDRVGEWEGSGWVHQALKTGSNNELPTQADWRGCAADWGFADWSHQPMENCTSDALQAQALNSSSSSSRGARQFASRECKEQAGVRFVVELGRPSLTARRPDRVRIIGDHQALGNWDRDLGIDLFDEGHRWTSFLIPMPPGMRVRFQVLEVVDPPELATLHPRDAQFQRRYSYGTTQSVRVPGPGEIAEITMSGLSSASYVWVSERLDHLFTPLRPALIQSQPEGSQRCYTFDAPNGVCLDFCLYLPPRHASADTTWPMLFFMHAMHGRLDGDVNLFFESGALPQLLTGDRRCPQALRENFVVLSPQCPRDDERGDGCGIWLRRGWFETSTYCDDIQDALSGLIKCVAQSTRVDQDRIAITGESMGGYGCLELASRWPNFFSACVPVSGHYEFDMDILVRCLTQSQVLPVWFFHATNDTLCPYEPMERLYRKLQACSRARVHFTSFEDTWSNSGHHANCVAYHCMPTEAEGQMALGEDLFEWFLWQRRQIW